MILPKLAAGLLFLQVRHHKIRIKMACPILGKSKMASIRMTLQTVHETETETDTQMWKNI